MKSLPKNRHLSRIVMAFVLTVCLVLFAFFGGFTSSRYYKSFPMDEHTFLSQNFYFSSDKLVEGGREVKEYDWDFNNNYTINLYNYLFETQDNSTLCAGITTTADISISGEGELINEEPITLFGGQKSTAVITVHPTDPSGSVFTVTATSAPYVKEISATFELVPNSESSDIVVDVEDGGNGHSTAKLKITIAPSAETNKQLVFYLKWDTAKLIPDFTDYLLTNSAHSPTPSDGGYCLTLNYGGYYEITLLKNSTTTNYSKTAIPPSTTTKDSTTGIQWYAEPK